MFANLAQIAFFVLKCRLSQNGKRYLHQIHKHTIPGGEGDLHKSCLLQPILAIPRPKIPIRYFSSGCDQMVKLRNFDLERVFHFGTLHQWCVKFLCRNFTRFGHPTAKNSDSVLSTRVRPLVQFENFDVERVFRFGTLCQWRVKFLSRIFYPY